MRMVSSQELLHTCSGQMLQRRLTSERGGAPKQHLLTVLHVRVALHPAPPIPTRPHGRVRYVFSDPGSESEKERLMKRGETISEETARTGALQVQGKKERGRNRGPQKVEWSL